jgi:hypothetical protein
VRGEQAQQGQHDANHAVHLPSEGAMSLGTMAAGRYTVAG